MRQAVFWVYVRIQQSSEAWNVVARKELKPSLLSLLSAANCDGTHFHFICNLGQSPLFFFSSMTSRQDVYQLQIKHGLAQSFFLLMLGSDTLVWYLLYKLMKYQTILKVTHRFSNKDWRRYAHFLWFAISINYNLNKCKLLSLLNWWMSAHQG